MNWGSVPEWIAAVGTVLAFVLALALGLVQERVRRRAERDEQVRQARLVVVGEPAPGTGDGTTMALFVRVTNYSDAPIYGVRVSLTVEREDGAKRGTQFGERFVIGPGEEEEYEFDIPPGAGSISSNSPAAVFMDAAGRYWRRDCGLPEPQRILGKPFVDLVAASHERRLDSVQP